LPGITDTGAVMLLMAVFGILTAVVPVFRIVALNRYAAPAELAPVLSSNAPTRTLFPEIDTETPNRSRDSGVGFRNVCSRAPDVASKRYAAPAEVAPVLSLSAPTRTLLPEMDTDSPNKSINSGVGFRNVFSSAPDVALNRYAAPAEVAPVLSPSAPTRTLFPEMDTDLPKKSFNSGVGFRIVCSKAPDVASKRYAAPAELAPVLSWNAPTRTLLPEMDTEKPNSSLNSGVGFRNVCSRAPDVASKRYAAPALVALVLSKRAPTRTLLPEIDELPN